MKNKKGITLIEILVAVVIAGIVIVLLLVFIYVAIKRQPKGQYMLDLVKLKIPVFGVLNQK